MGHQVMTLAIINDQLDVVEGFKPMYQKPDDICFWCHKPFVQEEQNEHPTEFGRYYARCNRCAQRFNPKEMVWFMEAGPIQGLIDQPMYNGEYPTGAFKVIDRDSAARFVKAATEEQVEIDDDTEEVLLYPDAWDLLEDFCEKEE